LDCFALDGSGDILLSVSVLGWELAPWRLAGTLVLSLSAGLLTHFMMQYGWLGTDILRRKRP